MAKTFVFLRPLGLRLGLKNFGWASKTRHLKSTLDAQHILPCHCEECVSTTSQSYDLGNPRQSQTRIKTCHSETPKAGSESVTLASNKQTLMSTDDRLTRFGQPQRFALSQVQGDEMRRAMTYKKCAFTLAEVLITLGIIGVVAALTIPTLMQKFDERETITKVKKMYTVLSQAYQTYIAENGKPNDTTHDSEGAAQLFSIFAPYLNVQSDCGTSNSGQCISNDMYKYKNGDNAGSYGSDSSSYKVTLSDGSSLWFSSPNNGAYFDIYYDENGKKGPNKWGYDLFHFVARIDDEKLLPNGLTSGKFESECAPEDSRGYACTAWVIYKENLDYLHCTDLEWNGKTKCD